MKQPSFKTIQEHLNVAFHGSDENPSTRTSKDNKTSPNPLVPKAALKTSSSLEQSSGDVSLSGEKKKVKLNTAAFSVPGAEKTSHLFEGDGGENYMMAFKSLTITSPAKQTQQEETLTLSHTKSEQSPKGVPNIADLMLHKRSAEQPSERENAERVDALLMELFPERYQKQASDKKGKGTKTSKKATALALATAAVSAGAGGGYIKNQVPHDFALSFAAMLALSACLSGCNALRGAREVTLQRASHMTLSLTMHVYGAAPACGCNALCNAEEIGSQACLAGYSALSAQLTSPMSCLQHRCTGSLLPGLTLCPPWTPTSTLLSSASIATQAPLWPLGTMAHPCL